MVSRTIGLTCNWQWYVLNLVVHMLCLILVLFPHVQFWKRRCYLGEYCTVVLRNLDNVPLADDSSTQGFS
jgi:hypothetical protein